MFSRTIRPASKLARNFSTTQQRNFKVCVVGGGGGIGQPLSLLLKLNPLVSQINLYDLAPFTPGVAKDISHIETKAKVAGFKGAETLKDSLNGVDIVICPAGVPRKPGMTRDDLFGSNASVVRDVAKACVEVCPNAILLIITNPVNSVVPLACKIYENAGKLNPNKIFGVSTLDIVRANTFVGQELNVDPKTVNVPVICGHSGVTIIPVFSKTTPKVNFSPDKVKEITTLVQQAGTHVVEAKAGAGSATLSMAYAGARMVDSVARGLKGEQNVVECGIVKSDVAGCGYFGSPLLLGKNGVEKNLGLPELNEFEQSLLVKGVEEMKKNIKEGLDFLVKNP